MTLSDSVAFVSLFHAGRCISTLGVQCRCPISQASHASVVDDHGFACIPFVFHLLSEISPGSINYHRCVHMPGHMIILKAGYQSKFFITLTMPNYVICVNQCLPT